ncbi:restriction endonuclease subunit S [Lactococcus lactis]|nr:restriction endonuclease subunit S [Lactococcus lactis]MDT2914790.1 restriction endonuclease subunit S [Lactococcus lactis]
MMSKKSPQLRFEGFTDDWEERKFKDILKTHSFRSYLADISENGEYEVIQQGDKPIVGYSDGKPFTNYKDITLFGDHTVSLYKPKRPFFVATDGVKILSADNFEGDYLYTTLERYKPEPQGYKRHFTILKNQDVWFTGNMEEQQKIGSFFKQLDITIALHQRKLDLLKEQKKGYLQKMFPKNGAKVPELRFAGFADDWEERKLGDEFKKVSERNDGSFGRNHWISVAKMYFQSPEKVQSNNIDTRTYVMREGDIAFEGHPNSEFKFGRFVANDIGAGVVSELFPIYRHQHEYDNNYWKNAIQIESTMAPIFAKSITSSGNSSNKLDTKHFLRQKILVPQINEQKKIGSFFKRLDDTIALHQRKLDLLKEQKKGYLQKMFV